MHRPRSWWLAFLNSRRHIPPLPERRPSPRARRDRLGGVLSLPSGRRAYQRLPAARTSAAAQSVSAREAEGDWNSRILNAHAPRDRIRRGMSFAAIGEIFAGFRVEKVIGTGAMGDVYLAEDTRSGDPVALKVLRPA